MEPTNFNEQKLVYLKVWVKSVLHPLPVQRIYHVVHHTNKYI